MIEDSLFCPFCGKRQKECDFQTKDAEKMMNTWKIEDIKRFFERSSKITIYSRCRDCEEWISINLDLRRMK